MQKKACVSIVVEVYAEHVPRMFREGKQRHKSKTQNKQTKAKSKQPQGKT